MYCKNSHTCFLPHWNFHIFVNFYGIIRWKCHPSGISIHFSYQGFFRILYFHLLFLLSDHSNPLWHLHCEFQSPATPILPYIQYSHDYILIPIWFPFLSWNIHSTTFCPPFNSWFHFLLDNYSSSWFFFYIIIIISHPLWSHFLENPSVLSAIIILRYLQTFLLSNLLWNCLNLFFEYCQNFYIYLSHFNIFFSLF